MSGLQGFAEHGIIRDLAFAILAGALAIIAALVVHHLLFRLLHRIAVRSEGAVDDMLVNTLARPSRWAFAALALVLTAREIPALDDIWERVAGFAMPALVGWMALAVFHAFIRAMTERTDISDADNRRARRRRTRLAIFSRIGTGLIVFVTVGLMLLSVPGVRDIGVTLMASAGLVTLAVGAAAQPALKSLIAGLQMALTEPIAIDDIVVIEGETGRVEDIKSTHVVIRTWDERRLIVPTIKFLDTSFQNWSRSGTGLTGTVMLYLDPMTEIAPLREEFARMVKASPLFDGRVSHLQVTNMTHEAIEVRLTMSAAHLGALGELRASVREGMLDWLRRRSLQDEGAAEGA